VAKREFELLGSPKFAEGVVGLFVSWRRICVMRWSLRPDRPATRSRRQLPYSQLVRGAGRVHGQMARSVNVAL